jgi:hypothetical protein
MKFIFFFALRCGMSVKILLVYRDMDRLCGLAVRVPGCYPRGPGSIPGATRFSE